MPDELSFAERKRQSDKKYREKNRDKILEYQRKWRERNREKLREQDRNYHRANRDKRVAQSREYYRLHREEELAAANKRSRIRNHELRQAVLELFGWKCCRCGFTDYRALCVDHINGGGKKDRKECGSVAAFYRKVLACRGERYQMLCQNCNAIKRIENKEHRTPQR